MPRTSRKLSRPSSGTPNRPQSARQSGGAKDTQGKINFPIILDGSDEETSPPERRRNESQNGEEQDNDGAEVKYLGMRPVEIDDSGDEYGRLVMLGSRGTPK
ncbi:hypothetical protein KEM55_003849 [Ascosphaera atra]|nr:hypothetical protein KEM55_003849 [Ascosphaera atra]